MKGQFAPKSAMLLVSTEIEISHPDGFLREYNTFLFCKTWVKLGSENLKVVGKA